ncbi:GNAT family N-acetyltransferase [Botrimarina mediterranea]|uniref:N-acetyltransferase domain-containing protein n=1 Tax=Botrimarina mediterranea TaxID=2528022 RepID=A0A518K7N8_9BACT|nr:GNAT family N-acetyltransferase [Botrimarina mediterranea]QDV73802.1 hypothetical protein Spa11_20010 [Botrimarina mediterranea]
MADSISYYVARRTLVEGSDALIDGAWPITWFRISKGWGMLPERFWPDNGDVTEAAKHEPANVDKVSKRFRLFHYQRLRSERECLYAVSQSRICSVALEITSAWQNPARGNIPDDYDLPVTGVHSLPLLDIDFATSSFVFVNSWGGEWGDNGSGRLSFDYLARRLVEGWTADLSGFSPLALEPGISLRVLPGARSHLGTSWIFEFCDGDNDVLVAWAHVLQTSTAIDVEELFVRPDYRRRGLATQLVQEIRDGAPEGLPIRFWIPWGDHSEHNSAALVNWARRSNITLSPSGTRWAAFVGLSGVASSELPALSWIPAKTSSPLVLEAESDVQAKGESSAQEANDIQLPWIPDRPAAHLAELIAATQEHEQLVDDGWTEEKSRRRAILVDKKYRSGLTPDELTEFLQLQSEFGSYQHEICPLPGQ